jgi:hypothetical protein
MIAAHCIALTLGRRVERDSRLDPPGANP